MPPTADPIAQILWAGGTTGLLAFMFWVIWAFMTGRIVRGGEVAEWKALALRDRSLTGEGIAVTRDVIREEATSAADRSRINQLELVVQFLMDEERKKREAT